MKNIRIFYLKIFSVLVVEFSIYLNRHIFLMQYDMIRSPDKGVFRIFFFLLHQNISCGYTLEWPHRGNFNEYQRDMF